MSEVLQLGAVVRDQYGRIGIVVRQDSRPSKTWIKQQAHLPESLTADTRWWSVVPLTGGMLLAPEQCLSFVRAATYEDFATAVDHSTENGRRVLASMFPQFTATALQALGQQDE